MGLEFHQIAKSKRGQPGMLHHLIETYNSYKVVLEKNSDLNLTKPLYLVTNLKEIQGTEQHVKGDQKTRWAKSRP